MTETGSETWYKIEDLKLFSMTHSHVTKLTNWDGPILSMVSFVFFNQQTGALHLISRYYLEVFSAFPHFEAKRDKNRKTKSNKTGLQPVSRPVEQILGVFLSVCAALAPKSPP